MIDYMENVAHAHAVDTRPSFSLPPSEGLGTRLVHMQKRFYNRGCLSSVVSMKITISQDLVI